MWKIHNQKKSKVEGWYEVANDKLNLNLIYTESKDEFAFIYDIKEHLLKSKIDKKTFKFGSKEVALADLKIHYKFAINNNVGVLDIHNKLPMINAGFGVFLGGVIGFILNWGELGNLIKLVAVVVLLTYQLILTIVIYKEHVEKLQKNINSNSYNKICLEIIENIENGVYDEVVETEVIIPKENIVTRLFIKLNR